MYMTLLPVRPSTPSRGRGVSQEVLARLLKLCRLCTLQELCPSGEVMKSFPSSQHSYVVQRQVDDDQRNSMNFT